jgi:hypothetical protein
MSRCVGSTQIDTDSADSAAVERAADACGLFLVAQQIVVALRQRNTVPPNIFRHSDVFLRGGGAMKRTVHPVIV